MVLFPTVMSWQHFSVFPKVVVSSFEYSVDSSSEKPIVTGSEMELFLSDDASLIIVIFVSFFSLSSNSFKGIVDWTFEGIAIGTKLDAEFRADLIFSLSSSSNAFSGVEIELSFESVAKGNTEEIRWLFDALDEAMVLRLLLKALNNPSKKYCSVLFERVFSVGINAENASDINRNEHINTLHKCIISYHK